MSEGVSDEDAMSVSDEDAMSVSDEGAMSVSDEDAMSVSDEDRARMRRLAAELATAETDEEPSGEARARIIAQVNEDRARMGLPALREEWAQRPEEELYRRARALGLRRIDR